MRPGDPFVDLAEEAVRERAETIALPEASAEQGPQTLWGRIAGMRFYLDDDLSAARLLGLDVISTRESGRLGSTDEQQLLFAAQEGRCLVTQNFTDFYRLTRSFSAAGLPHMGVLFISHSLQADDYGSVARALVAYDQQHSDGMPPYMVDYLHPVAPDG